MNKTRIAVAGTSGGAHVAVQQASRSCTMTAVVDPCAGAAIVAAKAGVPFDTTLEKDRPEGVIQATPNPMPAPQALLCMAAGLPLLIEKPIASIVAINLRFASGQSVI
jgi:predicted dehydrogenase